MRNRGACICTYRKAKLTALSGGQVPERNRTCSVNGYKWVRSSQKPAYIAGFRRAIVGDGNVKINSFSGIELVVVVINNLAI